MSFFFAFLVEFVEIELHKESVSQDSFPNVQIFKKNVKNIKITNLSLSSQCVLEFRRVTW